MDAYLTAAEARDLAASLPGMSALAAMDDDTLAAWLMAASLDIDASMRFQGRKVDPRPGQQPLEFPRVAYSPGPPVDQLENTAFLPNFTMPGTVVWDLDPETLSPIVPDVVKCAVLFQAAFLASSGAAMQARLDAIRSGLASQATGSASESYAKQAELQGGAGAAMLTQRALNLMSRYRLRTGGVV